MNILEKTDSDILLDRDAKLLALAEKSAALENKTDIDPKTYALEWLALAIEYSAIDAMARHDQCKKKYEHYRGVK